MVHILTIFMIFISNCHGGPIKNKVIDKLSEEALAADISTSDGSQALSSVQFRSKRSNNCCGLTFIIKELPPNLRRKSGKPVRISTKIAENPCNCKDRKQKYRNETVCQWNNTTKKCISDKERSVEDGCSGC